VPALSFLSPAFLAGILAVAIPIALHLFRRRPEVRVRFSAVRLLHLAPAADSRRRRVRDLILLALRATALVLLAVAFARPYLAAHAIEAASSLTVVAVDTSFSVSAEGQFARARRLAEDAVRRAPASHLVGLVSFADRAELVAPPTADRAAVEAAIGRLQPSSGGTRYRAALARVGQALNGRPGRVVVVTDLQRSGWVGGDEAALPERTAIDVADIAPAQRNLAVVDLARDDKGVTAIIRNSGGVRERGDARLALDGRPIGSAPFDVQPGATARIAFERVLPSSGIATLAVEDRAGFAADNTRYLVLDTPAPPKVILVTAETGEGEAFYVARALEVDGGARFRAEVWSTARVSRSSATDLAPAPAMVLIGTRGIDRRGREVIAEYVRQGGGLLLPAGQDVDLQVVRGVLGSAVSIDGVPSSARRAARRLASADVRHPIFRGFAALGDSLGQAAFHRVIRVAETGAFPVLARFDDGTPAVVEGSIGSGRVLVFASDVAARWNDLPLQPAFVPFLHEALRYLGRAQEPVHEYLVGDVPAGVEPRPGVARVPASPSPGTMQNAPRARVAVNVDAAESDLARMSVDEFKDAVSRSRRLTPSAARASGEQAEERQALWRYGLLLVIAGLLAEGVLGRHAA
jgi:Mg-chelatase subunit ChlD